VQANAWSLHPFPETSRSLVSLACNASGILKNCSF